MPPTKPYKAILAFVGAFLAALLATVQGRTDLDTMKLIDWAIVVGGALVVAGGVYQTPNPPKGTHVDEGGSVDVVLILLVAIAIGVTLLLFRVRF